MLKEEYEKLAQALHSLEHFCQVDCEGCAKIAKALERAGLEGEERGVMQVTIRNEADFLHTQKRRAALRKRLEELKESHAKRD